MGKSKSMIFFLFIFFLNMQRLFIKKWKFIESKDQLQGMSFLKRKDYLLKILPGKIIY
jgi:hypothetical protein